MNNNNIAESITSLVKRVGTGNKDNLRRLIRITTLPSDSYREIIDHLLDDVMFVEELDNLDILSTKAINEFIDKYKYIKEVRSNPENKLVLELDRIIGFRDFLKDVKSNYDFKGNTLKDINSIIPKVEVGKIDVMSYKNLNELDAAINSFYDIILKETPNAMTKFENENNIVNHVISNVQSDSLFDTLYIDKFKKYAKSLYSEFYVPQALFRTTLFNINEDTKAKLFIYASRSNFIINFTPNNEYLIYYINELIEVYNAKKDGLDNFCRYLEDRIENLGTNISFNINKTMTEFFVCSYFISKLDPTKQAPFQLIVKLFETIIMYQDILGKINENKAKTLLLK